MKSVLITGGCGFVGSHTCIEFLKRNYFVHIIDSNINSSENVIKQIKRMEYWFNTVMEGELIYRTNGFGVD